MTTTEQVFFTNPREWSDVRICEEFDMNPDMTLERLSRMTGKSVKTLKRILMGS